MGKHNHAQALHGSSRPQSDDPEISSMIERRSRVLGPSYRLFYEDPLHVVSGAGVWLKDAKGRQYLDVYNNVPSVGHCHPRVVAALKEQAQTINTNTRYLSHMIIDLAERLLATLPQAIDRIMFTCTGSEANDLALRLCNHNTGGKGIVVTSLAYHGGTMAVADMSPSLGLGVADHVEMIAPPDPYRGNAKTVALDFAQRVAEAFSRLSDRGHKPSAFVFDSLFSSDGVFPGDTDSLVPAVEAARKAGAMIVVDEVQPGFGRTGENFWGFQRHAFEPDFVTMGKPMGAGHPIAALTTRASLLDSFGSVARYFNTFGGNTVSCAVGLAVLDVIEEEGLQANALKVGSSMKSELEALKRQFDFIGDVRGIGLFNSVEFVSNRETKEPASALTSAIVEDMRKRQILISRSGPHGNALKLRPPLVFSNENLEFFLDRFTESLNAVAQDFDLK